jgi:hypothetical protein
MSRLEEDYKRTIAADIPKQEAQVKAEQTTSVQVEETNKLEPNPTENTVKESGMMQPTVPTMHVASAENEGDDMAKEEEKNEEDDDNDGFGEFQEVGYEKCESDAGDEDKQNEDDDKV